MAGLVEIRLLENDDYGEWFYRRSNRCPRQTNKKLEEEMVTKMNSLQRDDSLKPSGEEKGLGVDSLNRLRLGLLTKDAPRWPLIQLLTIH